MRIQSKTKTKAASEITLSTPDILKLAQTELARRKTFRLRLYGKTMYPTIHNGDWITLEPITPGKLYAGDILLLASSSQTALVHRLLRLEQQGTTTYVVTRGDSSQKLDMPVPLSNVVGRVSHIEHSGEKLDLTTLWQRLRTRVMGWKIRWQLRKVHIEQSSQGNKPSRH